MEFYNWQTQFDEFRKFHARDRRFSRNISNDEIFQIELENILTSNFKNETNKIRRILRLTLENSWLKNGRPYYNVHPQMTRTLCKTNLDKIPSSFIEVPGNLDVVCLRFAEPIETRYVDNAALTFVENAAMGMPVYCRSLLFAKLRSEESNFESISKILTVIKKSGIKLPPKAINSAQDLYEKDSLVMFLDEGFRTKQEGIDRTLCNNIVLSCRPEQTIPQAIEETFNELPELEKMIYLTMGDRLKNLLKVIISSGFLANSPEDGLVVPDILNADKEAYRKAVASQDQSSIDAICSRAIRRGKKGFNIGTNEMFIEDYENSQQQKQHGDGKELEFSHIRGGHPHAVRYGEGKSKVKIKWFRPVRVRPDLPFKA